MKNTKKLFAMMLMVLSVFFFACSDDEKEPLSPESAKTALNNMDDEMVADMDEMLNSDGFKAMQALNSMDDPFAVYESNTRTSVLPNIEEYLIPFIKTNKTKSAYEVNEFVFSEWTGTYTWDNEQGLWNPSDIQTDRIILIFPSDTNNMGVNDATLTIYNYEEQLFVDDYDEYYQPTAISADLYIGSLKLAEITLSATWATDGSPEDLDISVYLNPFTFSGNLAMGETSAEANFSILLNTTKIFSVGVDATFTDATKETPKKISGYVQYREIKVSASVNVSNIITIIQEIEAGTSPYTTTEELIGAINDEIDAKITKDGALVADIELEYDSASESDFPVTVVLVFSDGSSEPAQPYFEDFVASIEEFIDFLDIYFS
ncbi:MAG: hypothetical protein A2X13_12780 [Bacteroidetes bacterium GWC2_33_15]|nr:MAG: hypothetical protein A2X10_13915 [Bacteroidetes bacterium GWA2_33_15]OFX50658.1 MAG: hypothetical protein A2X13_12780 [Bacteroidetes bacterium GWC2_33_15]OFX63246.1 MAG: hypothetical protein A2X15_02020 [Bacteroidetes bacterium GWB2_32_14]OFX69807.1 MAG: hypothetical protein A2X14_05455 [Bacteroidetes bacterium GWD2_33_33]HAN19850.1 hypothetical protein [Bacteroidales bacterium]